MIALSQDNLKRRLAFSTIGQLGYVILGSTLATEQGMGGSVLHIAMHACGKITLFFCAGAIFVASGKKYVSELRGLGRKMPITMIAFIIATTYCYVLYYDGFFLYRTETVEICVQELFSSSSLFSEKDYF